PNPNSPAYDMKSAIWSDGKITLLSSALVDPAGQPYPYPFWGASPSGINQLGDVVGSARLLIGGYMSVPMACLWRSTGEFVGLPVLPGSGWTQASAINDDGVIVGTAMAGDFSAPFHAVMWANGTIVDLAAASGCDQWWQATGVNARGDVIGIGLFRD